MHRAILLVSLCQLLSFAVSSESSWAQDREAKSASSNLPGCHAVLNGSKRGLTAAAAYCLGVIDGIVFNVGSICVPNGISGKDEVGVVLEYIEARPARWSEIFAELAFEALQEKWPCKQ
jgi:Rap1a immunity proteins